MVGIPTPPERGCVQLRYVGISCSYVGHREGSHPMCKGSLNYTCAKYAQSFDLRPLFDHLSGSGRSWICWSWCPKVTRGSTRMCWEFNYLDLRQWFVGFQNVPRLIQIRAWQWPLLWCYSCRKPEFPLRKEIKNNKNTVISPLGVWEAWHVVHWDGFPWPSRSRKRGV
jgi:hypothetical protein